MWRTSIINKLQKAINQGGSNKIGYFEKSRIVKQLQEYEELNSVGKEKAEKRGDEKQSNWYKNDTVPQIGQLHQVRGAVLNARKAKKGKNWITKFNEGLKSLNFKKRREQGTDSGRGRIGVE
jgi:hypothetical protein